MPPTTLVYVGTQNGVEVLSHVGGQWRAVPRGLPGKSVVGLACPAENPATFYAAAQGYGVYKSEDTGLSWTQVLGANVHSLLLDPANAKRLWVGLEPPGIQRSRDGGQAWRDLSEAVLAVPGAVDWYFPRPPHEARLRALALVPDQPNTLLAGIEVGGLLRSGDGGETWTLSGAGLDEEVHALAVHPTDPSFWLAATGNGIYRSEDGGQTWTDVSEGLTVFYVPAVLVLRSGVCLAAAASGSPGNWVENANSMVYRSTDGADTWHAVDLGQPDYVTVLAADPHSPKSIYAGADSGHIYHSQNEGENWRQIGQVSAPVNTMVVVRLG